MNPFVLVHGLLWRAGNAFRPQMRMFLGRDDTLAGHSIECLNEGSDLVEGFLGRVRHLVGLG